jgi:hypothetical protein
MTERQAPPSGGDLTSGWTGAAEASLKGCIQRHTAARSSGALGLGSLSNWRGNLNNFVDNKVTNFYTAQKEDKEVDNAMRINRLSVVLPLFILLTVSGLASNNLNQDVNIEIAPTYQFSSESAQIVWDNGKPNLRYSITNASASLVPSIKVVMSIYDVKGYLRGRQRWVFQEPVPEWSTKTASIPIKVDLKDAVIIRMEFVAITSQEIPGCDSDKFCSSCSKEARDTCGTGKVQSVECLVGQSCSCSYTCRDTGPVLP